MVQDPVNLSNDHIQRQQSFRRERNDSKLNDTIMSERSVCLLLSQLNEGYNKVKYSSIRSLLMPRKCMFKPFDCDHCALTMELQGVLRISLERTGAIRLVLSTCIVSLIHLSLWNIIRFWNGPSVLRGSALYNPLEACVST